MAGQNKLLLQVGLPKWFRLFYAVGAPITLIVIFFSWFHFGRNGFTFSELLKSLFLLVIVAQGFWITPIFYSTFIVTEAGLERKGVSGSQQEIEWHEIVKVSRPRLAPGVAYVHCKTGKKLTLLSSMTGYTELLAIIEARAPNLSPRKLSTELKG